jgi:hypothetical protein
MIYRYISSKEILAKVARDLKPDNFDWEEDVLEWIGEALEYIGSGAAYEIKHKKLSVGNYRSLLPEDLKELKAVYNEDREAFEYGNQKYSDTPSMLASKNVPIPSPYPDTVDTTVLKYQGEWVKMKPDGGYFINGGYLIMQFPTGQVLIEYEGFKTDSDGFPMIPDAIQYRNAVFFYILRQMILGGYKHPDQQMGYIYVDEQWKRYCNQAQVHGGFPSVDKAMNFGKRFSSLVPVIREKLPQLPEWCLPEDNQNNVVPPSETPGGVNPSEIENLLNMLNMLVQPPVYVMPTASLNDLTRTIEMGSNFNDLITINFNKNDAGDPTAYQVLFNGAQVSTAQSDDVFQAKVESSITIQGKVTYSEGDIKKNIIGVDSPDGRITAGEVLTNPHYITPRLKIFYGAYSSDVIPENAIRNLSFVWDNASEINLSTGTTHKHFFVFLPYLLTVQKVTDVNNAGANITSKYEFISSINIPDGGNTLRSYSMYRMSIEVVYNVSTIHKIEIG